jgi:hypothetical protein
VFSVERKELIKDLKGKKERQLVLAILKHYLYGRARVI